MQLDQEIARRQDAETLQGVGFAFSQGAGTLDGQQQEMQFVRRRQQQPFEGIPDIARGDPAAVVETQTAAQPEPVGAPALLRFHRFGQPGADPRLLVEPGEGFENHRHHLVVAHQIGAGRLERIEQQRNRRVDFAAIKRVVGGRFFVRGRPADLRITDVGRRVAQGQAAPFGLRQAVVDFVKKGEAGAFFRHQILETLVKRGAGRRTGLAARLFEQAVGLGGGEKMAQQARAAVEKVVGEVVGIVVGGGPAADDEVDLFGRFGVFPHLEEGADGVDHHFDFDLERRPLLAQGLQEGGKTVAEKGMDGGFEPDRQAEAGGFDQGGGLFEVELTAAAAGVVAEQAGRHHAGGGYGKTSEGAPHEVGWPQDAEQGAAQGGNPAEGAVLAEKGPVDILFGGFHQRGMPTRFAHEVVEIVGGKIVGHGHFAVAEGAGDVGGVGVEPELELVDIGGMAAPEGVAFEDEPVRTPFGEAEGAGAGQTAGVFALAGDGGAQVGEQGGENRQLFGELKKQGFRARVVAAPFQTGEGGGALAQLVDSLDGQKGGRQHGPFPANTHQRFGDVGSVGVGAVGETQAGPQGEGEGAGRAGALPVEAKAGGKDSVGIGGEQGFEKVGGHFPFFDGVEGGRIDGFEVGGECGDEATTLLLLLVGGAHGFVLLETAQLGGIEVVAAVAAQVGDGGAEGEQAAEGFGGTGLAGRGQSAFDPLADQLHTPTLPGDFGGEQAERGEGPQGAATGEKFGGLFGVAEGPFGLGAGGVGAGEQVVKLGFGEHRIFDTVFFDVVERGFGGAQGIFRAEREGFARQLEAVEHGFGAEVAGPAMVHELRQDPVEPAEVALLEVFGVGPVQVAPTAPRQFVVGEVAQDAGGEGETVAAGFAVVHQKALLDQGFELGFELVAFEAGFVLFAQELLEILEVEGFAEHRGDLEHRAAARADLLETAFFGLLEGGRQGVRKGQDLLREGEGAVFIAHDAAGMGEGFEHLEAKERVAFGGFVQLFDEVGGQGRAAQEGLGEAPHVGRPERLQLEAFEARIAGETFEETAEGMTAGRFGGPPGADHQQGGGAEAAQEVLQGFEGNLAGVQVFEQENQRFAGGETAKGARQQLEDITRLGGAFFRQGGAHVGGGTRAVERGAQLGDLGEHGEKGDEVGGEVDQVGFFEAVRGGFAGAEKVLDQLTEALVGQGGGPVGKTAVQHAQLAGPGEGFELLQEAGFAGTGFAADHHALAFPSEGRLQFFLQKGQLTFAADERLLAAAGRGFGRVFAGRGGGGTQGVQFAGAAFERERQDLAVGGPIGRIFGQAGEDQGFEPGVDDHAAGAQGRRFFLQGAVEDGVQRAGEGRIAGEAFVEHGAEGVEVGAAVDRRRQLGDLFGAQVGDGAGQVAGAGDRKIADVEGQAEVHQPRAPEFALAGDHDVARFDVAVDDAAAVAISQAAGDFFADFEHVGSRQAAAFDDGGQGFALDQGHDDKQRAAVAAEVVDRHQGGMVELGNGLGFAFETGFGFGRKGGRRHHLDGHFAAQEGVVGAVDHTHAAPPELAGDAVSLRQQRADHRICPAHPAQSSRPISLSSALKRGNRHKGA